MNHQTVNQEKSRTARLLEQLAPYRLAATIQARTDDQIAEEVEKLLSRLSISDKIGQMSQCLGSQVSLGGEIASDSAEKLVEEGRAGVILGAIELERIFELQRIAVEKSPHHIPLLFNSDIIHGFHTIFPVPLAWACSWDMDAIKLACQIAAKEATATGITYNHAPMVDVTRDPRWGRVVEGAGEDPYLGSLIAKAQVEGFQGDSLLNQETMIACLKHFIGYGAAEGGRDYNTVDMSERTMREVFLPPFRAGLEAGAGSVMNAFNIYDGIPCASNIPLMKNLLREELGFDGMLITDYGSIEEIVVHGAAHNSKEAAKQALNATLDIEMVSRVYATHLPKLIEEGQVTEEQLDQAVRRILTFKYKIGIMDDPFRYLRPDKEDEYHYCAEHLNVSQSLARKSVVLLKNDGVLPLHKQGKRIAVIGPFSDSQDLLGPWQGTKYADRTITLTQGIHAVAPDVQLIVAQGCEVEHEIAAGEQGAVSAAEQADIVILALGESGPMSGEATSRMQIGLPHVQKRLMEAVLQVGKPTVLILTNGRPLILEEIDRDKRINAIVETWFLGSQAGEAIAEILFGDYNPSGRLTMSFPRHEGQIPVYYNHFQTGRPVTDTNKEETFLSKYIDAPNEPLFPFGYGLSYTTFGYSEIRLNQSVITNSEAITASVTVTNTGTRYGEDTVQLYIQDLYGSTVRPVKMLKDFRKVRLLPGESEIVQFMINLEQLAFVTADLSVKAEEGTFRLFIGPNSRDTQMVEFEYVGKNY